MHGSPTFKQQLIIHPGDGEWRTSVLLCSGQKSLSAVASAKMLTLLFQKVASHTVYFLCSQKRRRNTKQRWQINKSRFTVLFTIGMGWQSAGMGGGGLGPNVDVADGTGENSPRRSSLVEAADWCETQQHSKKARRESGSNEDLGNPKPRSAAVFRVYTRWTDITTKLTRFTSPSGDAGIW